MKYKTTGTRSGHKILVRSRETAFDKKRHTKQSDKEDTFKDHTQMKTYEYAAFQKKVFKNKKKQKRKIRILILISIITSIIIFMNLPYIINLIFNSNL